MTAAPERGFTLLEMLVALAVLSLGALALLNLAGESTRTAAAVEARLFAGVVAENRAIEALTAPAPVLGEAAGVDEMGLRAWGWTRRIARTADPALLSIHVRVADPETGRTAGEVTLFRAVT